MSSYLDRSFGRSPCRGRAEDADIPSRAGARHVIRSRPCALCIEGMILYWCTLRSLVFLTDCMHVCIVITYSKSKGQPGKVANPARG